MADEISAFKQHGFTLIELVSIIVLLGILSATILPRFQSGDAYAPYTVRDQLAAAVRYAQQRALYDHRTYLAGGVERPVCHRLWIGNDRFGPQRNDGTGFVYVGPNASAGGADTELLIEPSVSVVGAPRAIYFDTLGNALGGGAINCQGAPTETDLTLNGAVSLTLRIHETGYAQKL